MLNKIKLVNPRLVSNTSAEFVSLSCRLFLKRMVPEQVRSRCTWGYFFSTAEVNAYNIQQSNLSPSVTGKAVATLHHCVIENDNKFKVLHHSFSHSSLCQPGFFFMCKSTSSLSLRFVTVFRSSLDDEGSHKIFLFGLPCVSLSQTLPVV